MNDPYARLARAGSLRVALDEVAREIEERFDPDTLATFDRMIRWLKIGAVGQRALGVGDAMPDFLIPDHTGRLVSAGALLEQGPLVLSFFRGGWCPFCGLEMAALEQSRDAFLAAGAQLVGVVPEIGDFPAKTVEQLGLGYRLLADIDNGVSLGFGLVFRMPEAVIDIYRKIGLDLVARHGNAAWMVPIPGTFVIDRQGIIQLAFVEPDYRVRLDPAILSATLARLA